LAAAGKTGLMITLERQKGKEYKCCTGSVALNEVAVKAKPMPDKFISKNGFYITDAFLDYVRPLVGQLPEYVKLEAKKFTLKQRKQK
jgi:6-phosphofructokinase 1